MVRSDKERYVALLGNVVAVCDKLPLMADGASCMQALTSCQNAAINIGNELEACGGNDAAYVKDNGLVGLIEELCEELYVYSRDMAPGAGVHATQGQRTQAAGAISGLAQKVCTLIEGMQRTYRVVFLPYKASMWDSLESIWRAFAADETCETSVVSLPYYEADRVAGKWVMHYDGDAYPEDVPIVHYEDYPLQYKKPDIAFVHNPFDGNNYVTSVDPAFYSEELKKSCAKLVYVPYYVNPGILSDNYVRLPLLYRSDYVILQSEAMKETARKYPYYDRILPLGSPKFDKVIRMNREGVTAPPEWGIDLAGRKSLMLNTTIEDLLNNGELLLDKLRLFFELAAKDERILVIWRPHPLLEGTVKAMRPELLGKYRELVAFYVDNRVGVFDSTADSSRVVAFSDAYIGSYYSSIIALYEVCGKPVFRFDSKCMHVPAEDGRDRHRAAPEEVFCMPHPISFFGCNECDEYTFFDFVDDLVNDRLGGILEKQRVAEAGIANNLDGSCGEKVHAAIMEDYVHNQS